MTLCVRLYEKGLLDRYLADPTLLRGPGYAYVYAPRISQDDFVRGAVEERLEGLLTHYPALVHAYVARASSAEQHAAALERRASVPRRRASSTEQRPGRETSATTRRRSALDAIEHEDPAGVCRVCGESAPPARASRKDGLRVCGKIACRAEARRRDSVRKQRAYTRRRQADEQTPVPAAG